MPINASSPVGASAAPPGGQKKTGDGKGFEIEKKENGKETITYYDFNGQIRKGANVGAGDNNKTNDQGQRSWNA